MKIIANLLFGSPHLNAWNYLKQSSLHTVHYIIEFSFGIFGLLLKVCE